MIPVIKGDFLSLKNEAYFLSKFKLTKASLKKKKKGTIMERKVGKQTNG